MAENNNGSKTTREIRLAKRARLESIVPYVAPHIQRIIDMVVEQTDATYNE